MKKEYSAPKVEFIKLEFEDFITTSGEWTPCDDGHGNGHGHGHGNAWGYDNGQHNGHGHGHNPHDNP